MNDLTFDLYLFATVSGDWGISRRLWLIGSDCGERSITPEIRNTCSYTSVCTCVVAMAAQFSLERVFFRGEQEVECGGCEASDGRNAEKD